MAVFIFLGSGSLLSGQPASREPSPEPGAGGASSDPLDGGRDVNLRRMAAEVARNLRLRTSNVGIEGPRTAGVAMRFFLVSGREPDLRIEQVAADSAALGRLSEVAFSPGLTRVLARYGAVAASPDLHVFLPDDPGFTVAQMSLRVPVAGRRKRTPRRFRAAMLDGTSLSIQEPVRSIAIPARLLTRRRGPVLAAMLKHELGHAIHHAVSPIKPKGYREAMGIHSPVLRTNPISAFIEGFAQYTAYRHRDSEAEPSPPNRWELMQKNNREAYRHLLLAYWARIRRTASRTRYMSEAALDGVERTLQRRLRWGSRPPVLEEFRDRIAGLMAHRGSPRVDAAKLRESFLAFEANHPEAIANIRDEAKTPEEGRRELGALFRGAVKAQELRESGADETAVAEAVSEGGRTWGKLKTRSAEDLMRTEGVVAHLLLELDRAFEKDGGDLYPKILAAMRRDPYGSGSTPPHPVNIKELLALLDRDPDLHGRVFPAVTEATKDALTSQHFELAPSRQQDTLDGARAGQNDAPR